MADGAGTGQDSAANYHYTPDHWTQYTFTQPLTTTGPEPSASIALNPQFQASKCWQSATHTREGASSPNAKRNQRGTRQHFRPGYRNTCPHFGPGLP
eukprot:5688133-Prymnesium_polylepis.2